MGTRSTAELIWDPADARHIADPYPAYSRLRREAPVWRHPYAWVLSRRADVEPALRDRRLLNHGLGGENLLEKLMDGLTPPVGERTRAHQRPWILFQSGSHHSLMRRLLNKGFSPASLERARGTVVEVVDDLVDRIRDEPRIEFMESVAVSLPVTMISELFAVPEELRPSLRNLLNPLSRTMTGVRMTDQVVTEVDRVVADFEDAMRELIGHRRLNPGDDMISLLVGDNDAFVDESEVISNLGVLLFAGYETTAGLLGNGLLALLRHPEQRALLRNEPDLVPNAVEEMLRYDAPAQRVARVVHEPVEIGGQQIDRGELVWLLIGAANRDEDVWDDAATFDIRRPSPQPLSFGKGAHFCIGAPLARMEAQIAFPKLLTALGSYELDADPVVFNPSATLRAPSELWLTR
jgi:pimeloyl-[acyl-carrier protein] synthase